MGDRLSLCNNLKVINNNSKLKKESIWTAMKRALALLEKDQAPTDSRATAQEQTNILSNQGSYPKPRRAPSA